MNLTIKDFLSKWRKYKAYPQVMEVLRVLYKRYQEQEYQSGKDYYEFYLLVNLFCDMIDGYLPKKTQDFFYLNDVRVFHDDLYGGEDYKEFLEWREKERKLREEAGWSEEPKFSRFLRNKYHSNLYPWTHEDDVGDIEKLDHADRWIVKYKTTVHVRMNNLETVETFLKLCDKHKLIVHEQDGVHLVLRAPDEEYFEKVIKEFESDEG